MMGIDVKTLYILPTLSMIALEFHVSIWLSYPFSLTGIENCGVEAVNPGSRACAQNL